MAVLADAHERYVDRSGTQESARFADHFHGILFAIQKVIAGDSGLADQALLQEFAEARWMTHGQADILIQMKKFDALPIDAGRVSKCLEELELGCSAGRDHARLPTIANCAGY